MGKLSDICYIFKTIAKIDHRIPFGFATAMGLGAAALTSSPSYPTFPNPLTDAQNGAGLSSPATAIALLGKGYFPTSILSPTSANTAPPPP